jgi:CheY-like chemotaxis protein
VAHDLNNTLAPIIMAVELLKIKYPDEPDTLNLIETSAHRAADMVRQLLSFAKGAEGQRIALQPRHLLRDMEKIIKSTFPKSIELQIILAEELPYVLGDVTQLHQVLLNLCVNARDAMPNGGTLTLEAKPVEVDAAFAGGLHVTKARPGRYVALRVTDTGSGIAADTLDHIFDPFFTTKAADKGTGLGLSTVAGIVKGHGGFIQVSSQPGRGATFAVYLPVQSGPTETEILAKVSPIFRGNGELILFVDDESAVRNVARAVLGRLNFCPLTATDGVDALILGSRHRTTIRAVITDLHMPRMDGVAFVSSLRRILPHVPVIVASGRMDDNLAAEFRTLGVHLTLDKPFTEEKLGEALRGALESRAEPGPDTAASR